HPSRLDHAPAALRRGADGRRHRARHRAALGRHRDRRRSDLGPRAGAFMSYQDPHAIQSILHRAKTIAIVGLSPDELRASHFVGFYLKRHGYRVVPVNPRADEILGEQSYPSVAEIPFPVDVVDGFRKPDAVPAIAEEAVAAGAGALWLQFGVSSYDGA